MKRGIIPDIENAPVRLQALYGKGPHKEKGVMTNEYSKRYDKSKYRFLLDAPFNISEMCCRVMKKSPLHKFQKETGRNPITAQMAAESRLRATQWLKHGCNAWDNKHPISNPMSFWTENDVLQYIKENDIKIAPVYRDVVIDYSGTENLDGQLTLDEVFGGVEQSCRYKTTGCERTGCIFCGYGAYSDTKRFSNIDVVSDSRLRDYCMRGGAFDDEGNWKPTQSGLGMWFVIKWINVHGGFNVEIPDYERYEREYGNELTREYLSKE